MIMSYLTLLLLVVVLAAIVMSHKKDSSRPTVVIVALVLLAGVLFGSMRASVERQAIAAEQMAKSTEEQTRMLKDWGELMGKLAAEPVIMPPVTTASSPQK